MTPAEVALLIRAAPSKRDRILIEVAYAGGLRVSEIVSLTWADVLARENDLVQLSILGKGEKPRQVLLPEIVSRSLLTLRGDAGANDPVFASRRGRLTARAVGETQSPDLILANPICCGGNTGWATEAIRSLETKNHEIRDSRDQILRNSISNLLRIT